MRLLALAIASGNDDFSRMTENTNSKPERGQTSKTVRDTSPKVLGRTRDGVKILRQGRATHFTDKELRDAVATAMAAQKTG